MSRASPRKLVIDGVEYGWKVSHAHNVLPPAAPGEGREGRCAELFSAFVRGRGGTGLRIRFPDGVGQHAGYPSARVVWILAPYLEANLNLPSVARALIELARQRGWRPEVARGGLAIDDGFGWLPELSGKLTKLTP